jgi:CRP-like cAMP-binding protein
VALSGLGNIDLFAGLPSEAIAEIEAKVTWHQFRPDEQVFDKESDTLEVYFVVAGSVRILSYIRPDREVALANVVAGNYFGELAAIDGKERSARVVAIEESVLASIDGPEFMGMMMRHPLVAVRVLERFARIIRALDNRVTDLSTLSEGQRVMVELVRLARPDPRRMDGYYIPDLPNHKELASWTGATRETVAQTIGELARMGVVERRSMSLIVRDWSKLQALARTATAPAEH